MPDQGMWIAELPETVTLRLTPGESTALRWAAGDRGMNVEEWIQALVAAHVCRRPTWSKDEVLELESMTSATKQMATLLRSGGLDKSIATAQLTVMYQMFVRRLGEMAERQKDYWEPS